MSSYILLSPSPLSPCHHTCTCTLCFMPSLPRPRGVSREGRGGGRSGTEPSIIHQYKYPLSLSSSFSSFFSSSFFSSLISQESQGGEEEGSKRRRRVKRETKPHFDGSPFFFSFLSSLSFSLIFPGVWGFFPPIPPLLLGIIFLCVGGGGMRCPFFLFLLSSFFFFLRVFGRRKKENKRKESGLFGFDGSLSHAHTHTHSISGGGGGSGSGSSSVM